jgi:hypothetical protein
MGRKLIEPPILLRDYRIISKSLKLLILLSYVIKDYKLPLCSSRHIYHVREVLNYDVSPINENTRQISILCNSVTMKLIVIDFVCFTRCNFTKEKELTGQLSTVTHLQSFR